MRLYQLLFIPLFLLISACGDPAPDPAAEPMAEPEAHDHITDAGQQDDHHHHGRDSDAEPMAFLAIMQRLSADMAGLTHALWIEDYVLMGERAASIAAHPPTDPADTERIREILGDEYAAFEEADHVVHEAAEDLHRAVESRDLDAILLRLDELQRGCVACHSGFRDRLLTEGSTIPRR